MSLCGVGEGTGLVYGLCEGCAFKAPYAVLVEVITMPGSADCGEVT